MKILCSICARAGSKGLLKKNIKKFVNKPLIFYTINQAKKTNITNIIEFGGGIGKGDYAINKKPNLASIVKRYTRNFDNPPKYHAVINLDTLHTTVEELAD